MKDQESLRYPIGNFIYGQDYSLDDTRHHIELLARMPKELKKILGKLRPNELDLRYRKGGWSVRQVVHHVADSHMNAYIRMKMAITEDMPVIVVAPSDELVDKTLSNMQEVAARGGKIILITDAQGAGTVGHGVADVIVIPQVSSFVAPILACIPVQLLAYHTAVFMGTDVDQPRNLAKSVTVE